MIGSATLNDIPIWLVISFAIFYISHIFLQRLIRGFSKLDECTAHKIATKLVSCIQAIAVSVLSLRTLFIIDDVLYGRDAVLEKYILFGSSYFFYDLVVMYHGYVLSEKLDKLSFSGKMFRYFKVEFLIVLHHAVAQFVLLPILLVWMKNRGIFFIAGFFLAEISTPFYSIRNILKLISWENSLLYIINGILFTFFFFVGRVVMVPYLYYRYSLYKTISITSVPFHIPLHCNIFSFLFFMLQAYWFYLVVISLVKYQRKYFSKFLFDEKVG